MADHLVIEPDELRKSAAQHGEYAIRLRKWGTIPQAWLDEYPSAYGTIADPMHGALVDYYRRRHEQAERLASQHERTRDQLLKAADELEQRDDHSRQRISHAGGNGFDIPSGGQHPNAPDTVMPAPIPVSPVTQQPVNRTPPAVAQPVPATPGERIPQTPWTPAASVPQTPGTLPSSGPISTGTPITSGAPLAPAGLIPAVPTATAMSPARNNGQLARPLNSVPGGGGPANTSLPPRTTTSAITARPAGGIAASPSLPPNQRVSAAAPLSSPPPSGPMRTGPLFSSARSAEDKRPVLVVGDTVEDDLTLARALLAAVLVAVGDSLPSIEWATAVALTRKGPLLLLTSNEGRGWLPSGLFLPTEVVVPWRLDSAFRGAERQFVDALAGIEDPARMLAELVSIAAGRAPIRISALASSAAISEQVRSGLGADVAIADRVPAVEADTDFTKPGAGLADRLEIAGRQEIVRRAELLADKDIPGTCRELVHTARTRIHPIGVDVLPRDGFLERRLDELERLHSSAEPDRQLLRDMLYTYDHIDRSI